MRLLSTIQRCRILELADKTVVFVADADIDCDGSGGNPDHDPYFQPDTTYHHKGAALNAYKIPYVVVPPIVIKRTEGIVMGCRAIVTNLLTGKYTAAIVGDSGPTTKIGEISPACATRIGLNPNPNYGGTEEFTIGYEIFPGVGAEIDGVLYDLQSWRA